MRKTGPLVERPYLADANYHRLGYQLAAQLMHREVAQQKRRPIIEEAFEILYSSRDRQAPRGDNPQREAKKFAADAMAVIDHYQRKRNQKTWLVLPGKLTPKEERLEEFLRRTVLPCLEIVIAASLRPTDRAGAEAIVAPLRERAKIVAGGEDHCRYLEAISYRTLYNLACYETGGEDSEKGALSYLAAALERAPGARRRELGKWAAKDPSLASLQESATFRELVEPYA